MPPEVAEVVEEKVPSLRDTLESVIETGAAEPPGGEGSDPPPKEAPQASEEPPQPTEKTGDEPPPKEKPDAEEQTTQDAGKGDRAPKSWKADARAKWETTDPAIRAEVVRRERETQRALNESSGARQFAESFKEIAAPFAQRYHQAGIAPLQLIKNLMEMDHALAVAPAPVKAQLMAKLINDYSIDIGLLDTALSGDDPSSEPVSLVEKLIEQRLAPIQQFVQSNQQREQQRVQAEQEAQARFIDNMADDEVNFPHFSTVRQDMADIIEMNARRGIYLDPKTAYTRAVAMNPDAQSAEQELAKQRTAQRANNAATRALGASLSVNGAPSKITSTVSPDDLRGTLEAAFAAQSGR